jgi:MaoC like domain/MFE-2 hydratase 2 N-terminal domain
MTELDLNLLGKTKGPVTTEYSWKEAALYALSVGAGPEELCLLYEAYPGGMKVLPGFVVVPAFAGWPDIGDVIWPLMVHGEQIIKIHQPLPPSAKVMLNGKVANIYDKGKDALIEVMVSGFLQNGSPLFDAQWNIFYLGAGGFGGDRGPKSVIHQPPNSVPDFEITCQVPFSQAALYRLLGDLNPLHIDPQAAALAGFERPILHGLCTYGYAGRALVNGPLEGDPDRLKAFSTRFTSPVYPGDKLTVRGWRDAGRFLLEAETQNGPVLKNGLALVD